MRDLEKEKTKFQSDISIMNADVEATKEDFWKQKTLLEAEISHQRQQMRTLEEKLVDSQNLSLEKSAPQSVEEVQAVHDVEVQAEPQPDKSDHLQNEMEQQRLKYESELQIRDEMTASLKDEVSFCMSFANLVDGKNSEGITRFSLLANGGSKKRPSKIICKCFLEVCLPL
jgi:predicted  nucleic acid-binding Zn-ribbon protein